MTADIRQPGGRIKHGHSDPFVTLVSVRYVYGTSRADMAIVARSVRDILYMGNNMHICLDLYFLR
jgi:hypothetical protein